MRISVKAIPVYDIVKDIAKQWNVSIQEDSGELTIEIPEDLGEGFVRASSFDSGIGVIEYIGTFYIDYEIVFSINDTHPLKFTFCSRGTVDHTFVEDEELHTIDTFQNIIVSSSGNNGHMLHFKANVPTHVTSIEIIRGVFSKRNNHHFTGLDPVMKQLFEDIVAEKKFFYQGNYSMKSADIVDQVCQKEHTGFLRSVFLEGKLYDMLVVQIAQYQDDQREDKLPQIMRRSDVEKVKRVAELINTNIGQNYAVDFLAKEVGTNVNKLQEGFKFMYNLTVNKYIQQVKLNTARNYLMSPNSEHNISEIVNLIGLNNRSYFSKIFKEKYGVSPNYFLKSSREKEDLTKEDK